MARALAALLRFVVATARGFVFSTVDTRYPITVSKLNWCASGVPIGFDSNKRLVFYASLSLYNKKTSAPHESNTAPMDYETRYPSLTFVNRGLQRVAVTV